MDFMNLVFGTIRGTVPVSRDWEEDFKEFLEKAGFDVYGRIENDDLEQSVITIEGDEVEYDGETKEHTHGFDNGTFRILPYWWGDSDNIAELPNFVYYPNKYEMNWYKYPLRDTWANKEISYEEFKQMLKVCIESLKDKTKEQKNERE